MADDVVGSVTVDVHGNTDPLKNDVRRAAIEAGKAIDDGIGEGAGGTAITDNIVEQVSDAEKPAGREAKKVGKAIVNGVQVGAKDVDVTSQIDKNLKDAAAPLREQAAKIGETIAKETSAAAAVQWARERDTTLHVGVDVDRDRFRAGLRETKREWSAFGDELSSTLDKSFAPGRFDRLFATLLPPGGGGGGNFFSRLLPGGKDGEESGRKVATGMKKSILQAGIEKIFMGVFLKAATLGPLIGGGIRAAAPLITGLTSEVATLGTALGGLGAVGAASFATMIPAIGVLKFAFANMSKVDKKAMAAQFTDAAGELAGFKDRVREEMIPSLLDATKTVSKLAPEINKLGTDAAQAGGRVAKAFANMLVGRKEEISNIFGNSPKIMETFGNAGTQAVDVIINALDALQPLVLQVTQAIGDGIKKMTDSFNVKIDNGTFLRTMTLWWERGKDLLEIFKNLGTFLGNFFKAAAGASDAFLGSFRDLTGEWADWSESVAGQNTLKKMFDDARPVVEEVWGLLGDVAKLFKESFTGDTGNLVDFVKSIREDVIPAFEDFQKMLRESGIQDALFDLAGAVADLFNSGSVGTTAKVFLETLTVIVNVIGDLTKVLGPVLVPLGTFLGMFKALQITKTAFSGLFSLPAMLTGLKVPAETAATAIGGVATAADGVKGSTKKVVDGVEEVEGAVKKGGGAIGRFSGVMTGLGTGLNVAAIGYAALATAIQITVPKFDDSTQHIQELVDAAKKGSASLQETGKGIGDNFWERWIFTAHAFDPLAKHARTFGEEMGADLGTSFSARFKQSMALFGMDFGGIDATKEGIAARFDAITKSLAITGDIETAKKAFFDLGHEMDVQGVNASDYADDIHAVETAIQKAQAQAEIGLTLHGDFSSVETGMKSFSQSFDQNITQQLNSLLTNPLYVDAKTGGLNKAGRAERRRIIAEIDMTSLNGVKGAIDNATEKDIRKIYLDPDKKGFVDKFGQLTSKGLEAVVKLIVDDQDDPKNEERIKKRAKRLKTIADAELRVRSGETIGLGTKQQVGQAALRLYVPKEDTKKISDDIKMKFGNEIINLEAKLKKSGDYTDEEIQNLLGIKSPTILAALKIDEKSNTAKAELEKLVGKDWDAKINTGLDNNQYIKVSGQLLKLTKGPNGERQWTAVVGAEAETAEAQNDIVEVEKGKDGKGYTAKIQTKEEGSAAAKKKIDTAAKNRNTTITVTPKFDWSKWVPTYRIGPDGQPIPIDAQGNDVKRSVVAPPVEGTSSMISAGGPTTMGFGANLGPVGMAVAGRAGIQVGGGQVMGSPNLWTGKDKDTKQNVVINNYYPAPERVSDSVAMSLRIARYVGS